MNTLTIEVMADDVDGGYVASLVGLPGCVGQGRTVADALRSLASAYEGIRDTLIALDRELA